MNSIKLGNQTHSNAIKNVAFIFMLSNKISQETFKNILAKYEASGEIKKKLPRKQNLNVVAVEINSSGGVESKVHNMPELGSVSFSSWTPSGEQEWALNINDRLISINCGVYSRWDAVWREAREILSFFIEDICSYIVKEVAIEYVDEFAIDSSLSAAEWQKKLFATDSKFLPSNIFEMEDFWHVHQGYFINRNTQKILNNININCMPDAIGAVAKKVLIQTQHKVALLDNLPLTTSFIDTDIERYMQDMHLLNKETIGGLLTKEMCNKIGLKGL